jgi:GNAT superfamily N-acetyltransferase
MQIDVVQVGDTDESAALQAYGVFRDAWVASVPDIPPPTPATFIGEIQHPSRSYAHERCLAFLDGVPAGYLVLQLPLLDNLDNAEMEISVAVGSRRQGVGRALFAHATTRLRALGRKRVTGEAVESAPGSSEFCRSVGAAPALEETRSRLDIATIDQGAFDAMLASAWTRAEGYRVVCWQGVAPDAYIDDVAYLDGRFMTDAPLGDLEWEAEKVDADRVRQSEQRRLDFGQVRFHTGAVHEATDRLVAWTTLGGSRDIPEHLWQNTTIVDPDHRGHRLGTIIKLANLREARVHRPAVTAIDTFNASSNEYMLAINRAMGFRPVDKWMQWQLTV